MLKIAVCVSGGGTNLQAIIDGIESGIIKDTQIVLVFSNNPNAFALERAKKAGIKAVCKSPKEYPSRDDFNKDFLATLKEAISQSIPLALSAEFTETESVISEVALTDPMANINIKHINRINFLLILKTPN